MNTTETPTPKQIEEAREVVLAELKRLNVAETLVGNVDLDKELEGLGKAMDDFDVIHTLEANREYIALTEAATGANAIKHGFTPKKELAVGDRASYTNLSPFEIAWASLGGTPDSTQPIYEAVRNLHRANLTGTQVETLLTMLKGLGKGGDKLREDVTYEDVLAAEDAALEVVVNSVLFMTTVHAQMPGTRTVATDGITYSRTLNGVTETVSFVRGVPQSEADAKRAQQWMSTKRFTYVFPYHPNANKWLGAFYALYDHTSSGTAGRPCSGFALKKSKHSLASRREILDAVNAIVDSNSYKTSLDVVNAIQSLFATHKKWTDEFEAYVAARLAELPAAENNLPPVVLPPPATFPAVIADLNNAKAARNVGTGAHVRHRIMNSMAASVYDSHQLQMASEFWEKAKTAKIHKQISAIAPGNAAWFLSTKPPDSQFVEVERDAKDKGYQYTGTHVLFAASAKSLTIKDSVHVVARILSEARAHGLKPGSYLSMWVNALTFPAAGYDNVLNSELRHYEYVHHVKAGGLHTPDFIVTFQLKDPKTVVAPTIVPQSRTAFDRVVSILLAFAKASDAYFSLVLTTGHLGYKVDISKVAILTSKDPKAKPVVGSDKATNYRWPQASLTLPDTSNVVSLPEDVSFSESMANVSI